MEFIVDKVSEDSFYINMLLGLPAQLDKLKRIGVQGYRIRRLQPISHSDLTDWEHANNLLLPEDMRNFYSSTDGFYFEWSFKFNSASSRAIVGKITVHPLSKLVQLLGYDISENPKVECENGRYILRLGNYSKLFELAVVDDCTKVILVYLNTKYSPSVWLMREIGEHRNKEFYFLANDFTTYITMCVAHLGIPKWQLLYCKEGVPQWVENVMRLLAPHLLQKTSDSKRRYELEQEEIPINRIDMTIFKCFSKNYTNYSTNKVEKDKIIKSPRKISKISNGRPK